MSNYKEILNQKVLKDFGQEWKKFNQTSLDKEELKYLFNQYFDIFPFEKINKNSIGFDLGCGSGRWATFIAPKVKKLNCIDPSSEAILVAKKNLARFKNVNFFNQRISKLKIKKNSQDFGYCLGVLHHTSETVKGVRYCNRILKKGAPFLIYLYYNFENRNWLYRFIWYFSDIVRKFVSLMPFSIKKIITDILALIIYLPFANFSKLIKFIGLNNSSFPLSYYANKSFYTMRTDSLDRFGTKIEKRYSKKKFIIC